MHTPIRAWTEAQKARRARRLARRREQGHVPPPPVDADKRTVERQRLKRLAARRPERTRSKWKRDHGPETIAAWLRYLGFVAGGAPLGKHRRRKATRASRREARR